MTKDSNISTLPSGVTCKHAIRKWRGEILQREGIIIFSLKRKPNR